MTEPTKEQIKELWEWCGIKQDSDRSWRDADGIGILVSTIMPEADLNNLFKWAVPKLIPLDGTAQGGIEFKVYPGGIYCILTLQDEAGFNETRYFLEGKHDPALALFWAIWEVINA